MIEPLAQLADLGLPSGFVGMVRGGPHRLDS